MRAWRFHTRSRAISLFVIISRTRAFTPLPDFIYELPMPLYYSQRVAKLLPSPQWHRRRRRYAGFILLLKVTNARAMSRIDYDIRLRRLMTIQITRYRAGRQIVSEWSDRDY